MFSFTRIPIFHLYKQKLWEVMPNVHVNYVQLLKVRLKHYFRGNIMHILCINCERKEKKKTSDDIFDNRLCEIILEIVLVCCLKTGMNIGKCGPSKWHMVLGSNFVIDDTLNLSAASCCGMVSIPRFGSLWKVLRACSWKVLQLSKNKK